VNSIIEMLQEFMLASVSERRPIAEQLRRKLTDLRSEESARAQVAFRLAGVVQAFEEGGRAGTADVAVLVRQVIRTFSRRMKLRRELWRPLSSRNLACGLQTFGDDTDDVVSVGADDWRPNWLNHPQTIDNLTLRRDDMLALGDGMLKAMTGFGTYQSTAQKAAVLACQFGRAGSTTLVTLPTGAGKSLCGLLPAWVDSHGGRIRGGTTVVVVPTIALALDQQRQAAAYFLGAVDAGYQPQAWTGNTSPEERASIGAAVRRGTIPLLYTSPESLVESRLYDICLEAAQANAITRLVVDEAHIVQTWGAGFRTHFQFLAAYRRKLLAASGGALRTILLSATITAECEELLDRLFAEEGGLDRVQSNRLRPEIGYWISHSGTPDLRQERVLEALYHLPRPAILYVTRRQDAEDWVSLLRQSGFIRVAAFTGDTEPDERKRLIQEWSANEIDVMVATSAFGLGVDKVNVRAVIHACLPEDLNRFYQEVGRGGRDGCSAVSLLCVADRDEQVARELKSSALITPEIAAERWEGMRRSIRHIGDAGDLLLVDVDAPPANRPDMARSQRNRDWNEHTLLLMQRAGLLRIIDTREGVSVATLDGEDLGMSAARMPVKILLTAVTNERTEVARSLVVPRATERAEINRSLDAMLRIVGHYSNAATTECLSHELIRLYPGSVRACGGCPACRRQGREPWSAPLPLDVEVNLAVPARDYLRGELRHIAGARGVLNVFWERNRTDFVLREFRSTLVDLVGAGFQQIVLPTSVLSDRIWAEGLVEQLISHAMIPHVVLDQSWVTSRSPRPLLAVPTVIVYPQDDKSADELYRGLRDRSALFPVLINVVHRNVYLDSESGNFTDRVNGIKITPELLMSLLASSRQQVLF
jgi:ATP-dependent DNA helicase RecQ